MVHGSFDACGSLNAWRVWRRSALGRVGAASPAEAQPAPTGLDATGALAFIDRNGDGLKQDDEPFFSGLELDVIGTGWSNDTAGTTTQFTDAPWVRLTTQTDQLAYVLDNGTMMPGSSLNPQASAWARWLQPGTELAVRASSSMPQGFVLSPMRAASVNDRAAATPFDSGVDPATGIATLAQRPDFFQGVTNPDAATSEWDLARTVTANNDFYTLNSCMTSLGVMYACYGDDSAGLLGVAATDPAGVGPVDPASGLPTLVPAADPGPGTRTQLPPYPVGYPRLMNVVSVGLVPDAKVTVSVNYGDRTSYTPGEQVTVHYVVTNPGKAPLSNVQLVDGANTITCPATTLAPGASMECTAVVTGDGSDLHADPQVTGDFIYNSVSMATASNNAEAILPVLPGVTPTASVTPTAPATPASTAPVAAPLASTGVDSAGTFASLAAGVLLIAGGAVAALRRRASN